MNFGNNTDREEIVLTESGEVFNPIDIDTFLIVGYIICCLIGIPLNLSIAVTIIRLRRFHRKPRNIFLLGIIFSYLSFFIPAIVKLIYSGIDPDDSLCRVYVSVMGVPQGLLSVNMLLALADRYVAINHPLLHREKMTVRFASVVIIFSSIFTVFLLKFVYIVGLAPLRCELWLVHGEIILIFLTILFVLCTALNLIVYRQTRTLLCESRMICPSQDEDRRQIARVNGPQIEWIELATIENVLSITCDNNSATVARSTSNMHVNRRKFSQMEIEATCNLISGVTSLVVVTLPPTIFVSSYLACRLITDSECTHMNRWSPYLIDLGLINIVFSPLIFLSRNKELRTAIASQIHRCFYFGTWRIEEFT
uniref:G-protein coupled receptors family 1 profile domain-containing protein n=1 Tax=Daphnia galeata TaxID=27404 RepID=A0A8J2WLX0_9CRUS|nr:unnamed protein product [Daphnia galeata]